MGQPHHPPANLPAVLVGQALPPANLIPPHQTNPFLPRLFALAGPAILWLAAYEFHVDWDFSALEQVAEFGILLGIDVANQEKLVD
jgi:hypothetical protein